MARASRRSTCALDVETIRKLERVAARWRVSKSEVLRRAIDAVDREQLAAAPSPLEAPEELQKSLALTPSQARKWSREVRAERTTTAARHQPRGR